jgi:hypothetical protein
MQARRPTAYTVAMMLHARRTAERSARQQLALVRAHLEQAAAAEALQAERLRRAEAALRALLSEEAGPVQRAQAVWQREAALRRLRGEVQARLLSQKDAQEETRRLMRLREELQRSLRQAVGRREAVEMYEEEARRLRTRARTRTDESQEAEAEEAIWRRHR